MFILTDVLESSRKLDNLFELTEKSKKVKGGYNPYTWKYNKPHFFRGCDTTKVFPMAFNLYLQTSSEEELSDLLDKEHFLSIYMYYNEECTVSYISIMNLTIDNITDQKYKDLILSCRNRVDNPSKDPFPQQVKGNVIPCEINLGPFWYLFGADRMMCKKRRIENGFNVVVPNRIPSVGYIMGLELIGRDPHPNEDTEEKIKKAEEIEGIFITRK